MWIGPSSIKSPHMAPTTNPTISIAQIQILSEREREITESSGSRH
jgi:hypothetical protein